MNVTLNEKKVNKDNYGSQFKRTAAENYWFDIHDKNNMPELTLAEHCFLILKNH